MKNLSKMLKEAQKLQERMTEMQARLAEVEVSGSAGGGMVDVTLDGKGHMRKLRIDPSLVVPGEAEMYDLDDDPHQLASLRDADVSAWARRTGELWGSQGRALRRLEQ